MKRAREYTATLLAFSALTLGVSACSSNNDEEPDSTAGGDDQNIQTTIDPFFQQFLGTWQSPCLLEPDRLVGLNSGDYVVYELSFTENQMRWAYQDYLDEQCFEEWPHGNGSVAMSFIFSEQGVSESGLPVALFSRDNGVTIVEEVTGDPTPGDDSSGGASVSISSSSVPVLDIIHRSANGVVFLGDLTSAPNNDTAPTRLELDHAWTYLGDAQAPLD